MRPLFFSVLFFSLTAHASSSGCSPCGSYGSPFGPGEGYSYACYYVEREGKALEAFRFEDLEDCRAARNGNPECSNNLIREPKGESLCWRL